MRLSLLRAGGEGWVRALHVCVHVCMGICTGVRGLAAPAEGGPVIGPLSSPQQAHALQVHECDELLKAIGLHRGERRDRGARNTWVG